MQMRGRGTVGGRYDGKGWAVAKSGAKWGRGYRSVNGQRPRAWVLLMHGPGACKSSNIRKEMYSVDQLVEILDCARAARTLGQGQA